MTVNPAPFQLRADFPDYDNIVAQYQAQLSNEQSWNNLLTSGTGQTLLRFISVSTEAEMFALERALQESILDTARNSSSIYRIARMLGVHLLRRTPASVLVTVTRSDASLPQSIPAYSQWSAGGVPLFNREPVIMPFGVTTSQVGLYTGSIITETFSSNGQTFQVFALGNTDWSISDLDLYATIDNQKWSQTTQGLWRSSPTDQVFYSNSLPNGRVVALFGNGSYGAIPGTAQDIVFTYAVCDPVDSSLIPVGTQAAISGVSWATGVTVDNLVGYQAERTAGFYKTLSPALFAAQERAVTREDHRALTLTYPEVIDAVWLGQAEINPGDLRWMNVIEACLLTSRPWGDADWKKFYTWYVTQVGMAALEVRRRDPTPIPIEVNVNLFVFNRAALDATFQRAVNLISAFYAPQLGSLGGEYHSSDLETVLKDGLSDDDGTLVDYMDILAPISSVRVKPTDYVTLSSTDITVTVNYTQRRQIRIVVPIAP